MVSEKLVRDDEPGVPLPRIARHWPVMGARFLVMMIRGYQVSISPMLGPTCRYYPTCSHYAVEAIEKYGALKGGWLAIRRILRCHPFRPGGFDPVP